jgi:20S proteasome alpha/beta subunit
MNANIRNQRWFRRDRTSGPLFRVREPSVTVCIAGIFTWNYAAADKPPDLGSAALVFSDRMLTAGDVQYEPSQQKVAHINSTTLISVAGDFAIHSEAIKDTLKKTDSKTSPQNIATIYGQAIQTIKRREAEDLYLAPLGLNTDTFLAQQREMSEPFVSVLREQMQNHRSEEVAALVVGSDVVHDQRSVRIFEVNTHGMVSCHDDVAFAAIGSGAWHAKSRLMQFGWVRQILLAPALSAVYAAKKAAEVAPGVGKNATDMQIVFRDHIEYLREDVAKELPNFYRRYEEKHADLSRRVIEELDSFMMQLGATPDEQGKHRENPENNGGATAATTETAQRDEEGRSSSENKKEKGFIFRKKEE